MTTLLLLALVTVGLVALHDEARSRRAPSLARPSLPAQGAAGPVVFRLVAQSGHGEAGAPQRARRA